MNFVTLRFKLSIYFNEKINHRSSNVFSFDGSILL